jgi:hypothetical protein
MESVLRHPAELVPEISWCVRSGFSNFILLLFHLEVVRNTGNMMHTASATRWAINCPG